MGFVWRGRNGERTPADRCSKQQSRKAVYIKLVYFLGVLPCAMSPLGLWDYYTSGLIIGLEEAALRPGRGLWNAGHLIRC